MDSNTCVFDVSKFKESVITKTLNEVFDSLKRRGYNPINQVVGYLISGDPGYISNFEDAREKMTSLDRNEIVALLLKEYIKK